MSQSKKNFKDTVILVLFFVVPFFAIVSSYYKYYYTRNYDYIVEAPCDPLNEKCFIRSCDILDDCPPNHYTNYKKYYVKAYDFAKCTNNSCKNECSSELITCRQLKCGDSFGDICIENNPVSTIIE